MRCEVLQTQDLGSDVAQTNTDIEIWREATAYHTALTTAGPRDLARVSLRGGVLSRPETVASPPSHHCPRSDTPPSDTENNTADVCDNNMVDSSVPPKQQRLSELQKLKANCKSEELQRLKIRCEVSKVLKYLQLFRRYFLFV